MVTQSAYGRTKGVTPGTHWIAIAVVMLLAVALAACGGGASKRGSSHHPSPIKSATAAAYAVKRNWAAFFDDKTSVNRRIALLQNGPQFESIIRSESRSPMASSVSARVSDVKIEAGKRAAVTYSILVGGKDELRNNKGIAVEQAGMWKVGIASFCGLLGLENGGKTAHLPAACGAK